MRRTQIYLTDEQSARIAQLADDRHASKAEIIRRILDEALGIGDEHDDGARAVIRAVSGLSGLAAVVEFGSWSDG